MTDSNLPDNQTITDIMSEVFKLKTDNHPIVPFLSDMIRGEQDQAVNAALHNALKAKKLVTKEEWAQAERSAAIMRELGRHPKDCEDFVAIWTANQKISVSSAGIITSASLPILHGIQVKAGDLADKTISHSVMKRQSNFNIDNMLRKLSICSDRLMLKFTERQIQLVLEEWLENERLAQWDSLMGSLLYCRTTAARVRNDDSWMRCAKAAFRFPDASSEPGMVEPDVLVSILQKFIWQVKRKMIEMPVTNHLMIILFGPQEIGKSGFTNLFTQPLVDARAQTDFEQITDSRNIDLFTKNYVLVFDEMANADKAEMEAVKRVITADVETKRGMRSNNSQNYKNRTTMWGSTNKRITQLIRDETGLRRFFELFFSLTPDWDTINSLNITDMWRSVDEEGPDPTLPYMAKMREVQAGNLSKSTVEEWAGRTANWPTKGSNKEDSYISYKFWCEQYYPRRVLDLGAWHSEMQRLISYSTDAKPFPFAWKRKTAGFVYTHGEE